MTHVPRYSFAFLAKTLLLCITLSAILPVAVVLYINHDQTDERIKANTRLSRSLNEERIKRQEAINKFIYRECVDAEIRDAVIVDQNLAILRILRQAPTQTPALSHLAQTLEDGILALEPPGEPDCTPPAASTPSVP